MKLTSLTRTRRAACRGSRRSSLCAAEAPPKPPPTMTTFQATRPVLHLVTSCYKCGLTLAQAKLCPNQPRDFAPIRAALGLAHHGPHNRADRLRVAAPDLLGRAGLGLDRALDDGLQLARVRHLPEALALDDLGRVAALRHQRRQHLAGRPRGHLLGLHHPGEHRERPWRDLRARRVRLAIAGLTPPGNELAGDPVGDRSWFDLDAGGQSTLEELPQLGVECELGEFFERAL